MFRRGGTCPGGASYVTRSALPSGGPFYDCPADGARRTPSPERHGTTRPPALPGLSRAGGRSSAVGPRRGPVTARRGRPSSGSCG
ncbi:hypothetical protein GTW93_28715 [Streptomyces sp. SID5789]|nr:hypothetical protein [Streptomyces sp. SID5789]